MSDYEISTVLGKQYHSDIVDDSTLHPEDEHTWESAGNLTHATEAIVEFHQNMPQILQKLWMAYLDFLSLFWKWEDMTETDSCNVPFNHLDTKLSI